IDAPGGARRVQFQAAVRVARRMNRRRAGMPSTMDTVLIGYAQTDSGARALARAAEIAEAFRAGLVVVSVAKPEPLAAVESARERAAVRFPSGPIMRMPDPAPWISSEAEPPPAPEETARLELEQARADLARRG